MAGGGEIGRVSGMPDARIPWVDTARGLGIILVVYGHVIRSVVLSGLAPGDTANAITDSTIYAFHMPLFFVISGLVTRMPGPGTRRRFVMDRALRIAYPYLVWSVIFALAGMAAGSAAHTAVSWRDIEMIGNVPLGHFWFLYVLFFCGMVLLVPSWTAIAMITIAGMSLTLSVGMGRMPERTAYFLPFFVAGAALTLPRAAAFLSDARVAIGVALAGWATFLIVFSLVPLTGEDGNARVFVISRWVTGSAGAIGTLAVARLIGTRLPILCSLGRMSMPIYLMSPMASAAMRGLLMRTGITMPGVGWEVALTLAGLGLPWLIYNGLHAIGLAGIAGLDGARRPVRLGSGTTPTFEAPAAR